MLKLTAVVTENTVEDPGEGGRLVLHCDNGEVRKAGFIQAQLILNSQFDESLYLFPSTRKDKEARKFRVIVEEITE